MEFNMLPLEIQLEIFSYLPVCHVMKIREVCKQWNAEINAKFKFNRVRCCQRIDSFKEEYDFNFASTRSFFNYTSTDPKFSSVKCLVVFLKNLNYDQLEDVFVFLNSFKSLDDLKFTCNMRDLRRINPEIERKQFVVSLDRLKKASIQMNLPMSLVLRLPSLHHLLMNSLDKVTVCYPDKLKTLAIRRPFEGNPDYSLFTGLLKIHCFCYANALSISTRLIQRLPSLRELYLDLDLDLGYSSNHVPSASSRATVRIFYFGFEFDHNQIILEVDQWPINFGEPDEDTTRFIAHNLHRSIDKNPNIECIEYNAIASALDDAEMFGTMPQKFLKIQELQIIGAVADENRLLRFIGQFQIEHLELVGASLSPGFFEKLPENDPFIWLLEINSEPTMDILSGHFISQVFKLKNLTELYFDCPRLSLNFVVNLLRKLKSVERFHFHWMTTSWFSWSLQDSRHEINLHVFGPGHSHRRHQFSAEEASELMENLSSRLKVDRFICPTELHVLLDQLEFEKQNALFWMRKFIYEQRHSVYMPVEMIDFFY